ncbi:MAG: glycosyltransferase family 2 protein [Deltaproteobacteria bacterium]|nr:glycosyltransferase family 2 protein [Deltaproteobacteria bacterium]MBI3293261.1 glycosyltransferase family 2 protein [Deltaproteobacteria bacterium]
MKTLSIITPAYNEALNLPVFYQRVSEALRDNGVHWEWIIVDDHSRDETPNVIGRLSESDPRVRGYRLSRNFGAHKAVRCGLDMARGDGIVIMASDLQDPPEAIPRLLNEWQKGAQVVWAARQSRVGETHTTVWLSRIFHFIIKKASGISEMPAQGADFYLIDHMVREGLKQFSESSVNIGALTMWLGYRQTTILFEQQERLNGKSGWTLRKKLTLAIDTFVSFSHVPIRVVSCIGFATSALGLAWASFILWNALHGTAVPGWASIMIVVLVLGGVTLLALGVLGEYLWRTLQESRKRPNYVIESRWEEAGVAATLALHS